MVGAASSATETLNNRIIKNQREFILTGFSFFKAITSTYSKQ
ncbi:hypothetical protein HMPREF1150_1454 [Streptococcus sp. AS14]|nr:hypothetical protein HMPREF1150_1454 [Streptococcus sp. AS14]